MNTRPLTSHARFLRGHIVYLDFDLAPFLGVSTKYLNQVVKRNRNRFPVDLAFQITECEMKRLRYSPDGSPPRLPHLRYLPHVFTSKGVYMVATLIKTDRASEIIIHMLRTYFNGPRP